MSATAADPSSLLTGLEVDGFVVIPDALAPDVLATASASARAIYQRCADDPGVEAMHLVRAADRDPALAALTTVAGVLDLVRRALSDNIFVFHDHLDVTPPGGHATTHWHQDIDTVTRDCGRLDAPLCLKVGFYLTDVADADHGATLVRPGSHRPGSPPGDAGAVPVPVRAGTAIVFDHRLWHSRGLNRSDADRIAFFVAYAYRWIRTRDVLDALPEGGDLAATLRELRTTLPPETPHRRWSC